MRSLDRPSLRKIPHEALYNTLVKICLRDGKDISITYEEFNELAQITQCFYCTREVVWAKYHLHGNGFRYNLDRKDNTKGYHKDNVVVCCRDCNRIKGTILTPDEMVVAMQAVMKFRNNKIGGEAPPATGDPSCTSSPVFHKTGGKL